MSLDAEAQRALRCVTAEDLRGRVPPEVLAEALGGAGLRELLGLPAVSRCTMVGCREPVTEVRGCSTFPCIDCCEAHACPEPEPGDPHDHHDDDHQEGYR